ncbi:AMP-binding protein [Streptomyces sp. NPDC048193]|uniref:AMP-binding protein n=1 Tax=unclassified Streptomyces TaxID=2593676 RepID=UPI0034304E0F
MSEPQTGAGAGAGAEWCVVLNGEGQYSLWRTGRELPAGWRVEGTRGTRERCLARVQEVWADPRPAGLRRRTAEGGRAGGVCVTEIVGRLARRVPGAAAVRGDGFALSFGELDAAANRWARYLGSLGVGRGALVGVLLGRGAGLHAVTLGVWRAGAGCLPLDPAFPAARLRALLAATGARFLVSEVAYGPDGFEGEVRYVDDPEVCGALAGQSGGPLGGAPDPEDVAYVTQVPAAAGRPLAVAVTHGGLAHHVTAAARGLGGVGDGGTAVFSSVASESAVTRLWASLCAGRRVLLAPRTLDLAGLGEWLAAAAPFAFLVLTPGQLELLVRQLGDAGTASLAGVFVVAGGAPGPAVARLTGLLGPGRLRTAYGTAETSYGGVGPLPPGADAGLRVLDGACLPVPDGAVGELYAAGPGVALGYVGQAALTALRFVPDPRGPVGARMYRTGQLARRTAGGEVRLLGRSDRQLWVRGHRADPAETEEALYDHPGVGEAVVLGVRAAPGDVRLAAYVVPRPGAEGLDAAALAAHCGRRLPGHLVPATITLLDEVPRDADGRVERAALPGQGGPGSAGGPASRKRRTFLGGSSLAELLAAHRVPGACVAVLEDGALVAVEAAGSDGAGRPITPRTAFPVGTSSRYVAALGALRLVEEGVLAPDAVVGRRGDTPITLADVLGRAGDAPGRAGRPLRRAGEIRGRADDPLSRAGRPPGRAGETPDRADDPPSPAGRAPDRADVGALLLPALLEDVTGEAFGPLMRRLVLGPLRLDDSRFGEPSPRTDGRSGARVARVGHDAAGRALDGGRAGHPYELWTTAADLAEVVLELRRSLLGAPLALLGPDTAARVWRPGPDGLRSLAATLAGADHVPNSGPGSGSDPDTDTDPVFAYEAAPPGFHASSVLRLHAGRGLVVLANGRAGNRVGEEIEDRLRSLRRPASGGRTAGDGR